ncbi:hypothetical protein Bca4012_084510 [Brassica carinata]
MTAITMAQCMVTMAQCMDTSKGDEGYVKGIFYGSLPSLQAVLTILKESENRSGLAVSVQKSSFFSSGLSQEEIDIIQASTGMLHGSLLVWHLGVPLCSSKPSLTHYEGLLQQIKGRFCSWSAKALSFLGRLLIKTIISGINTFWCSSFVLPKACIKKINSLCGFFLWKGDMEAHHTARISWDTVTREKVQGGLGSVWVAWFKSEIMDNNLSNFWTVKPNRRHLWLTNKLLKIRGEIYPWIKMRIHNGESCRFWTDNWYPGGSITELVTEGRESRLGIDEMQQYLNCIAMVDGFFPLHALKIRNPTRDRLLNWGLATDAACLLCANHVETKDHLYFECDYSWELWSTFASRLGLIPHRNWNGSLDQMQNLTGNRFWKRILLLYWQATIYWTWMARNGRLHRSTSRTAVTIRPLIDRQIKEKILSVRDSNPASSSSLM